MKRLRLREADELVSDGAWFSDPDRVIGGVGADRDPKVFVFNPLLSADLGWSLDSRSLLWLLTAHYHWPQMGTCVAVWIPITTRASLRDGSQGPVLT